jgi:hypothetical protein
MSTTSSHYAPLPIVFTTSLGALYRLPRQALLDNTMAALPLGIARTAIDTLVEIAAGGKRPAGAGAPLAERTTVQADVARAEALYLSGRSAGAGTFSRFLPDGGRRTDRQLGSRRLARHRQPRLRGLRPVRNLAAAGCLSN